MRTPPGPAAAASNGGVLQSLTLSTTAAHRPPPAAAAACPRAQVWLRACRIKGTGGIGCWVSLILLMPRAGGRRRGVAQRERFRPYTALRYSCRTKMRTGICGAWSIVHLPWNYLFVLTNVCGARSTVEWSSLVVNGSVVLELDPVQGTLQPFLDDSPWHAGTQVQLDAGGARLLLLQTRPAFSRSLG